ncbi:MAG: hypothetical protein M4579_003319 [Chaenotheca gracillima]|nr:MAG: hypothetical protein M4579_003319 [Chaenotheca gracillima]
METFSGKERPNTIYHGTFIHSRSLQDIEILHDAAVGVDSDGKIDFILKDVPSSAAALKAVGARDGWAGAKVVRTDKNQFFFPGFIDTHIHASQHPNSGIFGKSTLLDWLNTYTFPLESSLTDQRKARTVYRRCVERTLSHGTTTAAYYATIDVASTNLLADICLSHGQRAFIGRVCMDSLSPDFYRDESAESALKATHESIDHIRKIDPTSTLVSPIITPRFAPSCSPALLTHLGDLHKETNFPIQTHISENKAECKLVAELFPTHDSYAAVYDAHGLLTPRTVLAHAIHLSAEERALILTRGSAISHCPASNSALSSGAAFVRRLLDEGITVGLGTDVSGGWSPSVLEAARQACLVSRHVAIEQGDVAKLSVEECLYLATRGGAATMGLAEKVGGFEVGKDWDAQLIGLGKEADVEERMDSKAQGTPANEKLPEEELDFSGSPVDIFGWESWDEKVAKWVFNGDDRNTIAVWVKGRLVHSRIAPKKLMEAR